MVTALARSAAPDVMQETELGPLPEDWRVAPLSELCAFENGDRGFNYPSKRDFQRIGVPFVNAGHLREGRIDFADMDYISQAKFNSLGGGRFVPGDVLFCLRGSLGKFAVVEEATPIGTVASSLVIVRPDVKKITLGFLKAYCGSEFASRMISLWAGGAAQPNLGAKDLARFIVALPPTIDEQQTIAEALSDADALIASLETLIAKKRAIKQGGMQELLSGQRRLPGYTKPWAASPLGSVCRSIVDGTHFTPRYVESGIPFYSVENVTADDFINTKFISPEEHRILVRRCKPERGDILLTRIGAIGDTKLIDWDVDASIYVSLALLKCSDGIEPAFLHAYTKSKQFVRDLEERSLLNAAPRKINMGEIGKVLIPLPEPDEQRAIAEVLDAMDVELVALEGKLAKARQIKQGMMQELLTGRVRLI